MLCSERPVTIYQPIKRNITGKSSVKKDMAVDGDGRIQGENYNCWNSVHCSYRFSLWLCHHVLLLRV